MHRPSDRCPGCGVDPTRRRLLQLTAGTAVAGLAGCGGGGSTTVPAPIALDGRKQCDVCGMVIEDHPGPNGQIFFDDHSPSGHDNPAWFDALTDLFSYLFEKETLDWKPVVTYVTDYSTVDYSIEDHEDTTYIESFVAAETFAAADEVVYVIESGVNGAMGPDLIPFSDPEEAATFSETHGGTIIEYEAIDQSMIARAMRG